MTWYSTLSSLQNEPLSSGTPRAVERSVEIERNSPAMPTVSLIPVGPQGLIGYGTRLYSCSCITWLKAPPPPHTTITHFFYLYTSSGKRFFTARHFNWIYSSVPVDVRKHHMRFLKYYTKSICKKEGCTKINIFTINRQHYSGKVAIITFTDKAVVQPVRPQFIWLNHLFFGLQMRLIPPPLQLQSNLGILSSLMLSPLATTVGYSRLQSATVSV